MKRILFLASALFILSSCSGPTPATPTPVIIFECFPTRHAFVWEDANRNGVYDPDESPLSGVMVSMEPLGSQGTVFSGCSGADGMAEINGIGDFGRRCDELDLEVIAPTGYEPTTPVVVSLIGLENDAIVEFGLALEAPSP